MTDAVLQIKTDLADMIEAQFEPNGWKTQGEAAKALGVSRVMLNRHVMKRDLETITIDRLVRMAEVAGLQLQVVEKEREGAL